MPIALAPIAALLLAGSEPRIEQLHWLTGSWSGCIGSLVVEEQWGRPAAGIMLGTGRNHQDGALKLYEFVSVFKKGGSLVYAPLPGGQRSVEFGLHHLADRSVEFRNPEHDFPQFIAYELLADGALQVRVGNLDADQATQYRLVAADPRSETRCGSR